MRFSFAFVRGEVWRGFERGSWRVDGGEGGSEKYGRVAADRQWKSWSEERREIQEHHLTVSDGATVGGRGRVTRGWRTENDMGEGWGEGRQDWVPCACHGFTSL